jgi:mannose-P-dolichol utilization defect protein 1
VVGLLIITGAFILKVPQILKIINAGSADGIGCLPLYMETFGFAITAATSINSGLSFTVYGETLVIIV